MEGVGELEAFAAVVYSSNWEAEIMPVGEERGQQEEEKEEDAEELVRDGRIVGDVEKEDAFESAWGKATERK